MLFKDLSFQLGDGESIAVTGANGSGKSTLLRILAGVLTPSAGSVSLRIDGRDLPRELHPLNVGLVAPYLNVYDGFTPRENLAFIARARRLSEAKSRSDEVLDLVGLPGRADDLVSTFSSGMKQRVKFAAALLASPDLLLLDEPRANLDSAGVEMVNRIVRLQQDRGALLVVATNEPEEALSYDRTLRVEDFK